MARYFNGCVRGIVIAKKLAEIVKDAMRSSSYTEGMLVEQREFKQLMVGDQARAL